MRGVRFVELDASRRVTRHAVDQVNNNLTAPSLAKVYGWQPTFRLAGAPGIVDLLLGVSL